MVSLTAVKPLIYVQILLQQNLLFMFNFNYSIPSCICSILTSVELLVYVQFNFSRTFRLCLVLTTVEPRVMSPLRTKGDILFQSDFFFRFHFCFHFFYMFFFSAKLVRTITCLSFQIGQLYLVCGCMTIRQCVSYRNELRETLTFDLKVK